MATKLFCDICGVEITPKEHCTLTLEDSIPALFANGYKHICGGEQNFDLCPDCLAGLVMHIHYRKEGYLVKYISPDEC